MTAAPALVGLAAISVASAGVATSAAAQVTQAVAIDRLGECLLGAEPARSRNLLNAPPVSMKSYHLLEAITKRAPGCGQSAPQIELSSWLVRATIAGAALRANRPLLADAALIYPNARKRAAADSDPGVMVRGVYDCAIAAEPAGAAEVVGAPPESPELSVALRKLLPALKACVPETAGFETKPADVRLNTADALYRRLNSLGQMRGVASPTQSKKN